MEIFTSEDAKKILWKKFVVVIGDSVQRCVYKDLVCLLGPNSNTAYLSTKELKAKGELEFLGDKLISGGQLSDVKTGIKYREVRLYDGGSTLLKFYFVTRCYSEHVESVLNEIKAIQPHVIIMNSCLWDLHRYGPRGPEAYRTNMNKLMTALKKVIPNDAVFIWNATLPLASKCKGGLLLPYYDSIPSQEIQEANFVALDVVSFHQFTFLDLHSTFRNQLHLRANDGIHWNTIAHRRISNLLLHQLCRSWNLPVPRKMLTQGLLPTPLLPLPLRERPLSRSFSINSNLDRYDPYVNPYEFDSPVYDKRYIVEESPQDHASSYKDRFRLISTPVPSPVSNPLPKPESTPENVPNSEEPKPVYTSTPVESSFKTKCFTDIKLGAECLPLNDTDYDTLSEDHLRQMLLLNQQLNRERKALKNSNNEGIKTASNTNSTFRPETVTIPNKELIVEPATVSQQLASTQQILTRCNDKENTPCNNASAICVTQVEVTVQIRGKEVDLSPAKPLTHPSTNQPSLQMYPTTLTSIHCPSVSTSQDKINVDEQNEIIPLTKVEPDRNICESTYIKVPADLAIDSVKVPAPPGKDINLKTVVKEQDKEQAVKAKKEGKVNVMNLKIKPEFKEKGVALKVKKEGKGRDVAAETKEQSAVKTATISHCSRSRKRKPSESLDNTSKSVKVETNGGKVEHKRKVKSLSSKTSEHSVQKPSTSSKGQKRKATDSSDSLRSSKTARVDEPAAGTHSKYSVPNTSTSSSHGQKRKASDSSDSSQSSKTPRVEKTAGTQNEVQRNSSSDNKLSTSKTSDSTFSSKGNGYKAAESRHQSLHSKGTKGDKRKVILTGKSTAQSSLSTSSALKSSSGHVVRSSIPVFTSFKAPLTMKANIEQATRHQRSNSMMANPVHPSTTATSLYPMYQLPYQMTQADLAHQQMMINNAIHRRQSYPPAFPNPYMNSWDLYRGYYYHDNKRY